MRSRRIVDHTEVDGNGFHIGGESDESHSLEELWPQIRSLELRATSRDGKVLKITDGTVSDRKQMLQRESLELRNQARILKNRIYRIKADNLRDPAHALESVSYWPRQLTG